MPEYERATEKGGELWTIVGRSSYHQNDHPRLLKIKHYDHDFGRVYVSIGAEKGRAMRSVELTVEEAEEASEALAEACEKASDEEMFR